MNITSITDRLFLIKDFLTQDLLNQLSTIEWATISADQQEPSGQLHRRKMPFNSHSIMTTFDHYVWDNLKTIESATGVEFDGKRPVTAWWYDEPGYVCPIHTDGHLVSSMQLYWYGATEDYGTVFYNSKNPDDTLYKFKFISNSGYLMLNQLNEDGSQPLQWHGALNIVPVGMYRLSSYTYLHTYKTK